MKIAVARELGLDERRVALSPDGVARLTKAGHAVHLETGAGAAAFMEDTSYEQAGAVLGSLAETLDKAHILLTVGPPGADSLAHLAEGTLIIGLLGPTPPPGEFTCLAMERVPRVSRAQGMDALSSQATVAGYRAVLLGASLLPKFLPMLTTAAGTIPPARVVVLGVGVAGLQAIATAHRLGAAVYGYDVRSAVKEQVESLGATFWAPENSGDAEAAGGYARELTEEERRAQQTWLGEKLAAMDLIVTTAQIPNKPPPLLITEEMTARLRPGTVVVDTAGGNCAVTVAGETRVVGGVTYLAPTNLPSGLAYHASLMYSRNLVAVVEHLVGVTDLKGDPLLGPMVLA